MSDVRSSRRAGDGEIVATQGFSREREGKKCLADASRNVSTTRSCLVSLFTRRRIEWGSAFGSLKHIGLDETGIGLEV